MSGDKEEQGTVQQDGVKNAVMSRESAQAEYDGLLEYYDIREEEITGDDESAEEQEAIKRAFKRAARRVVDSIQDGKVVIEYGEECTVTQNMYEEGKSPLLYHEVGARAKKVLDKGKESANYARMFAFMATLAKIDVAVIEIKKGRDFRLMEALSVVFTVA